MYQRFVEQYPKLGQAWDLIADQGADGPLDERTQRLIKLGIAMGAMRTGAVHSGVRKALALGIAEEELEQVVALAAGEGRSFRSPNHPNLYPHGTDCTWAFSSAADCTLDFSCGIFDVPAYNDGRDDKLINTTAF